MAEYGMNIFIANVLPLTLEIILWLLKCKTKKKNNRILQQSSREANLSNSKQFMMMNKQFMADSWLLFYFILWLTDWLKIEVQGIHLNRVCTM